ncbi:hypothetical protein [Gloeocapsopsis sp. IPPAS B-1203]|uniref:hypothetical protein n=1 Tax=Gloeocapsopsis sp. IPPAS B-1203 TaxID=2049454 RepID=UPI000C183269|nr:hypothetical protein [Gloeocapsopsis sp. IPPAS B-1203]PIG93743.1 hypothetical protein CSQ79_08945 [Gloeocapsopsis sp. IPPAS B-1203]
MTKTIVNLTLPILLEEIELALNQYPHHPYQQAFSNPDFRQELIAYVLSRVFSKYVVVDDEKRQHTDLKKMYYKPDQKQEREAYIHEGIHYLVDKYAEYVYHHIPSEVNSGSIPSNWFG